MDLEQRYTDDVGYEHIKKYGQYFTNYPIASFMANYVLKGSKKILDPAFGNGIFFKAMKSNNLSNIELVGYELDKRILTYFEIPNLNNIKLYNEDFLFSDWDEKYDAIICNPPYKKFQSIPNRKEIIDSIYKKTGVRLSGFTNMYVFFLIKSIFQLSDDGKMAFIIPIEFLNSKSGEKIKEILVQNKLLEAIIYIKNDKDIFSNADTTSCILLVNKEQRDHIEFYQLDSYSDIENFDLYEVSSANDVSYDEINSEEKWLKYFNSKTDRVNKNLVPVSEFCKVKRGIATGSNSYFLFSEQKRKKYGINKNFLLPCVTKSADVNTLIFDENALRDLVLYEKLVYIANFPMNEDELGTNEINYLDFGLDQEIYRKHLPSKRKKWFLMEKQEPAPIWVSTAFRGNKLKVIRNLTRSRNLTTFHSMYINKNKLDFLEIIYCYFITPLAQSLLFENKKIMGNGLNKFQPNDINNAFMLDLTNISKKDITKIKNIYSELKFTVDVDQKIEELNSIFLNYL